MKILKSLDWIIKVILFLAVLLLAFSGLDSTLKHISGDRVLLTTVLPIILAALLFFISAMVILGKKRKVLLWDLSAGL